MNNASFFSLSHNWHQDVKLPKNLSLISDPLELERINNDLLKKDLFLKELADFPWKNLFFLEKNEDFWILKNGNYNFVG